MGELIGYDKAEICLNGHVTNSTLVLTPDHSKPYCDRCGSRTVQECVKCRGSIQGRYLYPGEYIEYKVPFYCIHCGEPYPWIKERLEAARELAELVDEFTEEDRQLLISTLDDLVRDTPRTQVAAIKFKKVVRKASTNISVALKDILTDVLADGVKESIWGIGG